LLVLKAAFHLLEYLRVSRKDNNDKDKDKQIILHC